MSLGLRKVLRCLRTEVMHDTRHSWEELQVPVEDYELGAHIDVGEIAKRANVSISTVYATLAALENVGAIRRLHQKRLVYAIGWIRRGADAIPLDLCFDELKQLSTVTHTTPYRRFLERLKEGSAICAVIRCAQRARIPDRAMLRLLKILRRKLAKSPRITLHLSKARQRRVEVLEEQFRGIFEDVFRGKSNFSDRVCKRLRADVLDTKMIKSDDLLYYIYKLKDKRLKRIQGRELVNVIFRTNICNLNDLETETAVNQPQKRRKPQRKRSICRARSNTRMQRILNAWGDSRDAVLQAVQARHEYMLESKAPQWFKKGMIEYDTYLNARAKDYKLELSLFETFSAMWAYRKLVFRKNPPAVWWKTEEAQELFKQMVEANLIVGWKKYEADEQDLEDFESWKILVQKEAAVRGLPDPLTLGHKSLRNYNEWILFKAMRLFMQTKKDYEAKTRLQMDPYDFVVSNMNYVMKAHRRTYEDLCDYEARTRAWSSCLSGGQFNYVDPDNKPEWQREHNKWIN